MNEPQPLRRVGIGMVGIGGFGGFRRQTLRSAGCFDFVAYCDRNSDLLSEVCRQEQVQAASSFDELVANPAVEAIVISTGIDTHAQFALRAMAAGKHVFIEKPLCGTVEEAAQLKAAARDSGCVVGVGHHDNAADPTTRLVHQFLASGELGTLVTYEENSSHSGGLEIRPGDWRGSPERNPGGMLMQCGVHALHRLNDLFGPITKVAAMMRSDANPATQTTDAANVLLRHDSGLLGTLNCYHVTPYCHELRIFGTRGALFIDTHAHKAWFQRRRRNEVEPREPVEVPKHTAEDRGSNVVNWHRAIVAGGSANPSLDHGVAAVLPVFAAERAARLGREVELASLGV